jgi:AcrR family transcriptional regulator
MSHLYHKTVPKRVDHVERRRQIAEAVVRIAAARGLQEASMREVAAAAGMSLRLVQYYFHTKEELLGGVLGYLGERIGRRVQDAVSALGEAVAPAAYLRAMLGALIPHDEDGRQVMLAYTAHFTLTLSQPHLAPEGLAHAEALRGHVSGRFRQARDGGQLAAGGDPDTLAATALALVTGLQLSVLANQHTPAHAMTLLNAHLDHLFTDPA